MDDDTTCDGDGGDLHQHAWRSPPAHASRSSDESRTTSSGSSTMRAGPLTRTLQPSLNASSTRSVSNPTTNCFSRTSAFAQIGAEDDLPARELEVDGQCNGPSFGREGDSSHATSSQMRVALLPGQSFECGMTACSSPAGSAVNIASGKSGRGRVQDERDEIQGSSTQTCVRTPLEVPEIRRIDAGTLRQFLSGEAELLSAMGHSPGKVARVGRTGEGCPGSGVRDVGGVGMYSSGDTRSHKAIVSRLAEVV